MSLLSLPLAPHAWSSWLANVDTGQTIRAIVRLLLGHGARCESNPVDLTLHHGPFGRVIATTVLSQRRLARVCVAELRAPFRSDGIVVVAQPHTSIDAPILVADLIVNRRGNTRVYLDAVGPASRSGAGHDLFRSELVRVLLRAPDLRKASAPAWIAPLSLGATARFRAHPRKGGHLANLLVEYTRAYLAALDDAPAAISTRQNREQQRAVRNAFVHYGYAEPMLGGLFGASFAERFIKLMWDLPLVQNDQPHAPPAKVGVKIGDA